MMNIINGGAHADNSVDVQEFMIAPVRRDEVLRSAAHGRGGLPHAEEGAQQEGLLDRGRRRGRLCPHAEVQRRGHRIACSKPSRRPATSPATQIGICLDPASSEYFKDGKYVFKKSDKSERTSRADGGVLGQLGAAVSGDPLDRRRHGGRRLGRLEAADRDRRRQDPARRRRPVRHQSVASSSAASTKASPTRSWSRSTRSAR